MSHQLTVLSRPGYLHIQVTGENEPQTVVSYIAEVSAVCEKKNASVVLVEENLQGPGLNMFDIFKVFPKLRQTPPSLHWIVYVDTNPAHDPAMMEFAKEMAIKRGLRVRLCRSVAEAEDWIKMIL